MPVQQIQSILDVIRSVSPQFIRMGVMNRDAISIAYSPLTDEGGNGTIGVDFSDRPYIPIIQTTRAPYIGDVVMGRFYPFGPVLPLVVPFPGPEFRGFCGGIVNLFHINQLLATRVGRSGSEMTLLDRQGQVIAATKPGFSVMSPFVRPAGSIQAIPKTEVEHWVPEFKPGTTLLHRWQESYLFRERMVSEAFAWKIIVDTPVLPIMASLTRRSTQVLWILSLLIVIMVPLSHLFSLLFTRSLDRLQNMMETIPERLETHDEITWPDSRVFEIDRLMNHFRRMAFTLRDYFHQLKSLNETLEQRVMERTDQLHRKTLEMERFTYTVSHDLRSPLVTIKTFLGFLEQDVQTANTDRIQQDLGYIHQAADRMKQLLDELLDISRIGRIGNLPVRITARELVEEALQMVAGQTASHPADIRLTGLDLPLYGDRSRLLEIWLNLIENALKYMGDQSHPKIEIGSEGSGRESVFFVKDNGMGIPAPYQQKIFNLFEQLNPACEGTGIGLTVVRRIVELYGGTIRVISEGSGQGTCFSFTLPDAATTQDRE
jgi:signal transduction histidine kinase